MYHSNYSTDASSGLFAVENPVWEPFREPLRELVEIPLGSSIGAKVWDLPQVPVLIPNQLIHRCPGSRARVTVSGVTPSRFVAQSISNSAQGK